MTKKLRKAQVSVLTSVHCGTHGLNRLCSAVDGRFSAALSDSMRVGVASSSDSALNTPELHQSSVQVEKLQEHA